MRCTGVVTVNLYTMRNEALDIFTPNRAVMYAILTGVFYAVADIYFLKLSGDSPPVPLVGFSIGINRGHCFPLPNPLTDHHPATQNQRRWE